MSKKENKKVKVAEATEVEEEIKAVEANEAIEGELVKSSTVEEETSKEDATDVVVKTEKKFKPFHKLVENPKKTLVKTVELATAFGLGCLTVAAMHKKQSSETEVIDAEFTESDSNVDIENDQD